MAYGRHMALSRQVSSPMPSTKTKPNQPCRCGSGKKYKKCCKISDDKEVGHEPAVVRQRALAEASATASGGRGKKIIDGPPLRFKIGERILANVDHAWLPGVIVDTYYREPRWPEGKVSPYQVLLDEDERLIHAPFDGDNCVQSYDFDKDESASANIQRAKEKKKRRSGKSQLREESRRAEELSVKKEEKKKAAYLPERGNEETNRMEFSRSGMIGARFLLDEDEGDSDLKYLAKRAGWDNLKLPPDVMDEDSLVELLEVTFSCIPQLRSEDLELDEDTIEILLEPDSLGLLPSLLRMCIAPEQYDLSDGELEPSAFVWDVISLLKLLQSQSAFRINGSIARELCSIVRVCASEDGSDSSTYLAWEIIDPIFCKASESAFLAAVDEMKQPYPGRAHTASLASRAMLGEPWAEFEAHVKLFCDAISEVLVDPSSSEETRGLLFGQILSMLESNQLAERVLSTTLDTLRYCRLHLQVDTTMAGGFETLIKTASQTIAAANGNEDEWYVAKEIFRKDSRGIVPCYCSKHSGDIPKFVCEAELSKETKESIMAMMSRASMCIENSQYDEALECTTKILQVIETEVWSGAGYFQSSIDLKRTIHALRGRAQVELGDFEDALYCLQMAMGVDPTDGERMLVRRDSSKMQCDACFDGIRALASLGRIDAANGWYSYLIDMKASGSDGGFTSEYLKKAQAKASILITNINGEPKVSATLIEGEPALEGISCDVRQCSWKSVGKIEEDDGSMNTGTFTVPRLQISLVWIRGQLLIWNYQESKIVQWIQRPSPECCYQGLLHTSDNSSIFVLFGRDGFPFVILLDQLHRLIQGGTCSAEDAMIRTLEMDHGEAAFGGQTFDNWFDQLYTVKSVYGVISEFAVAQVTDTKDWSMAMIDDSANMEILIFTGRDTIAPNTLLGPFALLQSKASFVLKGGGNAHTQRIYSLIFVENGCADTLVSSSSDKSIKVWDIASRCCKYTIRGFSNLVRTFACSNNLLFGVADKGHSRFGNDAGDRENRTFGSHCINVWNVESGQHMATLRSRSGKTVETLNIIPERNILLSGHTTGEVHLWSYDKIGHMIGFQAIPSQFASGLSFHLHQNYVVVMSMTHLLMFQDPTQTESDKKASLPSIGQSLNCGNCGLWKISSSQTCSRCKNARFCDESCLRAAWPKHKKICAKRK